MNKMKRACIVILCAVFCVVMLPAVALKGSAVTSVTKQEALDWILDAEGRYWDWDGAYGAQCVDLIYYYYNYLGVSPMGGNANCYIYDEYDGCKVPSGWERIQYYSGFVAQSGDIALFDYGTYGHIGLVIDGDPYGLVTLENNRNDASGSSNAQSGWRAYDSLNFWGVIRPDFPDSSNDSADIEYKMISVGDYYLKNNSTGKYLSVDGGVDADQQNISVTPYTGGNEMKLSISAASTGYIMRPHCSTRIVNPYGFTVSSGLNVSLWPDVNDSTQWWGFQEVSGGYVIHNIQNPTCVLDISETNVIVSTYTGAATQIWSLESATSYTVRYDANGGTGAPDAQTKVYGKTLTLSSTVPTRAGYSFLGWSTSSSATSATYSAGGSFTANADTALYAVWKANTYTISYNANGGVDAPDSQTKYYGQDLTLSAVKPTRKGYTFLGWSPNSADTTATYQPGSIYTQNADMTLYAVWKLAYSLGDNVSWSLSASGDLEISGFGEMMYFSDYTEVPWYGFRSDISRAVIEDGVTNISNYLFYECDGITTITIPSSIERIGNYTFFYCNGLTDIYFTGDAPSIATYAFEGVTATAYYPAGNSTWTADKLENYAGSITWKPYVSINNWNMTLGDDFAVNFYVEIIENIRDNTVISMEAGEYKVTCFAKDLTKDENGMYRVSIHLAAAQMTDTLSIQFLADDMVLESKSYTVRQYADYILSNEYDNTIKQLIRDMLNYGAAAQNYFGYNTDALANAGVEGVGAQEIGSASTDMTISDNIDGVSFYGVSLLYRSKTAVRFYFSGDVSGCTFKVDETEYTPMEKDGMWYVEVADIAPQMLDTPIDLAVNSGEDTITVQYSPMNYMVRMYEKGSDNLKALIKAMYNYHLAAVAYSEKWPSKAYTANWNTGNGYTISVNRIYSPYAGAYIGAITRGTTVYYGDVLSVNYVTSTGYTLTNKGSETITVSEDVTSSDIYAVAVVNSYVANWYTGTGYTIVVKRISSPYAGAATGVISNGTTVYYGDVLSVTYTASMGYTITSNGTDSVTVYRDVTSSEIYANAERDSYLVTWTLDMGYTISVRRTASPYAGASIGALNYEATVYYGDVIEATYTANEGYTITEHGKTVITVTGRVTSADIYAYAEANSYTHIVAYKSSNGTDLGTSAATYKYGTTNTIYAPVISGYDTPSAQCVSWDSTSTKTITFIYKPTEVATSQVLESAWWWSSNGNGVSYTAKVEYQNRTADSVQLRVVWTQTIQNASYGTDQYAYVSFWMNDEKIAGTEHMLVATADTWPYYSDNGPWHTGSVTTYSNWVTIPLNTTNAVTLEAAAGWWDAWRSGECGGKVIYIPAY